MTKYCPKCDQTLPVDQFSKNISKPDGLQATCKKCHSVSRKHHYNTNKAYYLTKAKKRKHLLEDELNILKCKSGCKDCGSQFPTEPWLLDFDHVRGVKSECVSFFVHRGYSKKLLEEIKKCEIVCLICHRRRTAQRAGWSEKFHARVCSQATNLLKS